MVCLTAPVVQEEVMVGWGGGWGVGGLPGNLSLLCCFAVVLHLIDVCNHSLVVQFFMHARLEYQGPSRTPVSAAGCTRAHSTQPSC